jgi:uncharacterized protein
MSAPPLQAVLIAKAPVPGRVKTRLCPPCTPEQAAAIAAAALADTVAVLDTAPVVARTLAVEGDLAAPLGWHRITQRGPGLGERLAAAYADTARPGVATLLVGMDTPQLSAAAVAAVATALTGADAVLGPALDGGWWGLALRDPHDAEVLAGVPMSTADTGALTLAALRRRGRRVVLRPALRDVDTVADALAVARLCSEGGAFARAVAEHVGGPA